MRSILHFEHHLAEQRDDAPATCALVCETGVVEGVVHEFSGERNRVRGLRPAGGRREKLEDGKREECDSGVDGGLSVGRER